MVRKGVVGLCAVSVRVVQLYDLQPPRPTNCAFIGFSTTKRHGPKIEAGLRLGLRATKEVEVVPGCRLGFQKPGKQLLKAAQSTDNLDAKVILD